MSPTLAWVTLGVTETIPSSASTLGGGVVVGGVVGVVGVGAGDVDVVGVGVTVGVVDVGGAVGGFGFGFGRTGL